MYKQQSRQNNNNLFAALTEHNDHSEDENPNNNNNNSGINNSNNNSNNNNVVHPIFEQFSANKTTKPDKNENNNKGGRNDRRNNQQQNQVSHVPSIIQQKPPPVGEGENQLESPYTFWFTQRGRGAKNKPNTAGDFEQNIRYITTVSSVEQFWRVYTHLVQPSELNGRCDIHVFRYRLRIFEKF